MIVAYIDGGARGNPGPAGYGVRIEREDESLVTEFCESIGIATNNVAEYRGLIAALEWARAQGERVVRIRSDSLLLVQQMLGNYKVKNPGLQTLHAKARLLAHEIGRVTFEHVERAKNSHADRLANQAMDAAAAGRASRQSAESVSGHQSTDPGGRRHSSDLFTPDERHVRQFVYQHFVETGKAPALDTIAAGLNVEKAPVAAALKKLADMRALVLAPATTTVWMAHPFSAVPTDYPVAARGRIYWANCAWDAAGILSLLGDGECRTRCADCGIEVSIAVRDGRISGAGVVHYVVPPRRFWENVAFT